MMKFVSVLDDPKLVYKVEGRFDAQLFQSHVSRVEHLNITDWVRSKH